MSTGLSTDVMVMVAVSSMALNRVMSTPSFRLEAPLNPARGKIVNMVRRATGIAETMRTTASRSLCLPAFRENGLLLRLSATRKRAHQESWRKGD
jgi:hypothetical protein